MAEFTVDFARKVGHPNWQREHLYICDIVFYLTQFKVRTVERKQIYIYTNRSSKCAFKKQPNRDHQIEHALNTARHNLPTGREKCVCLCCCCGCCFDSSLERKIGGIKLIDNHHHKTSLSNDYYVVEWQKLP